ncbi:type II toxin-antitoxin system RelE/ParE family toxin [Halodesulfovibrio aestuarii]|uniref:type II toxin-antitoxin system RelE/ParE family toxin n=1 Tax=Halodesulfovibrio aestuarii TaxID=126333 RepID=UPI000485A0EF
MSLKFKCNKTEKLYRTEYLGKFHSIANTAIRKLSMLEAATNLRDLKIKRGNKLEALRGTRSNQYSIRINKQWRICFVWDEEERSATQVEIVDYH